MSRPPAPATVFRVSELLAEGHTRRDVQRLTEAGRLVRLRPGWLSLPGADPAVVRAVSLGGVLSCVSALAWHGVWVPEHNQLHLRRTGAGRLSPLHVGGVRDCGRPAPTPSAVDPLAVALRNSTSCLTAEGFVVVLDSILNLRLMGRANLIEVLAPLPGRQRRLLEKCDRSEAGTESMVRLRLRSKGVKVRSQVSIPGVGRVDLLVGDCLVIEVDSREHHTKGPAYEADRERDRRLTARGYRVVRLTYQQVVHDWARVEADLLRMIRQDLHGARAARDGKLLGQQGA